LTSDAVACERREKDILLPVYMITSIGTGFLSRLLSSQLKIIIKLSKWKKDWLEKILDRKPAPIEVIM